MDRRGERLAARRVARRIVGDIFLGLPDGSDSNEEENIGDQPVVGVGADPAQDQDLAQPPMDIQSDSGSARSGEDVATDSEASAGNGGERSRSGSSSEDSDNSVDSDVSVERNEDNVVYSDQYLRESLKAWACKFDTVSLAAMDGLLRVLKPFHPDLPLSAKTVMDTPQGRTDVKLLDNGQFAFIGIKKGLEVRLKKGVKEGSTSIKLDVNIDGVAIFGYTDNKAWNIAGRSLDLVDTRPFLIGMFYGEGKPSPLSDFLEDFIAEANALQRDGLNIDNVPNEFKIDKYICDAESRSYLKCCKASGSVKGCEKCEQEGFYDGQVVYSLRSATLRTDASFNARSDPDHHHDQISPLQSDLNTGMVSQFILDVMHLRDLGVMKRFLVFITQTGPLRSRMDARGLNQLSDLLIEMVDYLPCEFNRKLLKLKNVSKWKAAQLRLFLFYLGVVVMCFTVRDEVYKLFLLFHIASVILSNDDLLSDEQYLDNAEVCLQNFVDYSARVLGRTFVSYNVHSLLHLCSEVRIHGNADKFLSAYTFEDHHRTVKRLIRSQNKPLQQVVRRLQEREGNEKELAMKNLGLLNPWEEGPLAGLQARGAYQKFACDGVTYCLTNADNGVSFHDEKIGRIQNIVQSEDDSIKVIVKLFRSYGNCYDYALPSSELGIFLVSQFDQDSLHVYDIKDVKAKCVLLPFRNGFAAFPLLHLCQCKHLSPFLYKANPFFSIF